MPDDDIKNMSEPEILERILQLGFDGDRDRYDLFCQALRFGLPPGTGVALRGSVVTGKRWEDGAPFDALGPRTSDLDLTLIGQKVKEMFASDAFYIPGIHTKPLGDKDPHIAPQLNELREVLQRIVHRPVNIQATDDFILYIRDVLLGQPYFVVMEVEKAA
jgi:hypothetical protein